MAEMVQHRFPEDERDSNTDDEGDGRPSKDDYFNAERHEDEGGFDDRFNKEAECDRGGGTKTRGPIGVSISLEVVMKAAQGAR